MDPPEETQKQQRRTVSPQQRRYSRAASPHMKPEFILIFTLCYAILSYLKLHSSATNDAVQNQNNKDNEMIYLPLNLLAAPQNQNNNSTIENVVTSGVGLVTTEGQWDDVATNYQHDIKMLGFADNNYVPIAKVWYDRLTKFGHKEHYIVATEKKAYDDLMSENYRVLPCFVDGRSSAGIKDQRFFLLIMAKRVELVRDMVRNGTHVLLTDVDNIFSRYINLAGFVEEGYDVYHAYEMQYPLPLYRRKGFTFCSGHIFFRSSEATLRFLDKAVETCGEKCDDQIMYNNLFWSLDIEWDGGDPPSHPGAMRIASNVDDGLLVESATGRSRVTNHTFKIWDRDFAWRLGAGGIPEFCPSKYNWVGMPAVNSGDLDLIKSKLALVDVWDSYCLKSEEKRVKIVCNSSVADCSLCMAPSLWCKSCWIDTYGQEKTCVVMDAHATKDPFYVEDVVLELIDGGTVRFCGSNNWKRTKTTCNKRAKFLSIRYHISERNAKISLLENLENGCRCSVDGQRR